MLHMPASPMVVQARLSAHQMGFELLESSSKRDPDAAEALHGPCIKRSKADMLRAGSLESACTKVAGLGAPARPWHVTAGGRGGTGDASAATAATSKRGHMGSAESRRSVLDAPDVLGSGASNASGPSLAQPPCSADRGAEAAAEAAAAAAARPQQERQYHGISAAYIAELAVANACLRSLPLPGGLAFSPVHPSCALLPLAAHHELPPAAVALGASYFQRLLAGCDTLAERAMQAGFFSRQPTPAGELEAVLHSRPGHSQLLTVLCTCMYLGTKVCEGPQFANQLSSMLSAVHGQRIRTEEAADMEVHVLKKLDWRLGPYRCLPGLG